MSEMSKDEEIKKLRRQLKDARAQSKEHEQDYWKAKNDLEMVRGWMKSKFLWFVDLSAKGERPCLKFLIKDMAEMFNKMNRFYWGGY